MDDVVKAAKTSHGTFYLYFANKEDLFKALTRDALHDMDVIAREFPRVTPDDVGRAALRHWVQRFFDTYATHATVIRILSQADVIGEDFFSEGLQLLFGISEAIAQGMTGQAPQAEHSELTALACLMMLERVNYLLSVDVRMPAAEMAGLRLARAPPGTGSAWHGLRMAEGWLMGSASLRRMPAGWVVPTRRGGCSG